jgi:hypothetical protein
MIPAASPGGSRVDVIIRSVGGLVVKLVTFGGPDQSWSAPLSKVRGRRAGRKIQ